MHTELVEDERWSVKEAKYVSMCIFANLLHIKQTLCKSQHKKEYNQRIQQRDCYKEIRHIHQCVTSLYSLGEDISGSSTYTVHQDKQANQQTVHRQ